MSQDRDDLSRKLDKSMDALERTIDLADHLVAIIRKEKRLESMQKRILYRIEDLIADVGRWDVGQTESSDTKGVIWMLRVNTDVIEGQLAYEISGQECDFELWVCPTDVGDPKLIFTGAARYAEGNKLQTVLQGLETALETFPEAMQDG